MKILILGLVAIFLHTVCWADSSPAEDIIVAKLCLKSLSYLEKGETNKSMVTQVTIIRGVLLKLHKQYAKREAELQPKIQSHILEMLTFLEKNYSKFEKHSQVKKKNLGEDKVHQQLMGWLNDLKKNE